MRQIAVFLLLPSLVLSGCAVFGSSSSSATGGNGVVPYATPTVETADFGPASTPDASAYGKAYRSSYIEPQYRTGPARLRGAYAAMPGGEDFGETYSQDPAHASKSGYAYAGLGAQMYDVEQSAFGGQVRLGYQTASVIGAELEGSFGVIDDKPDGGVNSQFGAFALARVPLGSTFNLVPRVGYHITDLNVTGVPSDQDGLAYGGGLELNVSRRLSVRGDYTFYDGGSDGLRGDSASLSVQTRF